MCDTEYFKGDVGITQAVTIRTLTGDDNISNSMTSRYDNHQSKTQTNVLLGELLLDIISYTNSEGGYVTHKSLKAKAL